MRLQRLFVLLVAVLILSLPGPPAAEADQVFLDDLIVTGSACIGADCVAGEEFGYNTLVLKEEDIRINFQDTSTSAAFPTTDWDITVNDSTEGGENYFAIGDRDLGLGDDFRIDASDNTFHIMADRVEVGSDDSPRILGNVADGVAADDAVTVGQLQPIQDTLDALLDAGTNQGVVVNNLENRVDAVEAGVVTLDGRLDAAEADVVSLNSRLDTVEQGLSDQDAAVTTVEGEIDSLDSRLTTLATEVADTSAALTAQSDELAALGSQVTTNTADIEALQAATVGYSTTGGETTIAASATGIGSTALGDGASARTRDTAIGYNATVTADGSVALGADTVVDSENSVAVGADSAVASNAAGGVALGQNAQVLEGATGAVAIGQNSVASEADTVSVGSTDNERRITHVAAGVNATDAVNLSQLQELDSQVSGRINLLDRKIKRVEQRLDQVGAVSSAFSAMVPNPRDPSPTQISLGLGHYSGATALAAGLFHAPSDSVLINTGVSTSFDSNTTAGRAGITFGW